jgi:DNA polymerase III sliding clamp (beta) subunit (PCNA family)
MKIPRQAFLKALNTAKPALAAKELIIEMVHFFFTGKSIIAYNDKIGIEVPFQTEFEGGLDGKTLLGILDKSVAKEVELQEGERRSEMVLRCGNARANLSLLDPKRAIWQFPKYDERDAFAIDKDFVSILGDMLICVGQNVSTPDTLGITFVPSDRDEEWLDLYSTDMSTMAWARLDLPKHYRASRCCVPEEFCKQLVALCKDKGTMIVEDDCVMALLDEGVKLYGRLVDVPRPLDFAEQVEETVPDPNRLVDIPNRFKMAIERVSVVIEHLPGEPCEISIDDENVLRLYAKADRGEIRDAIRLKGDPHEEISNWFDPALIKRGVDNRTDMFIGRDALVMRGPDNYYQIVNVADRRR